MSPPHQALCTCELMCGKSMWPLDHRDIFTPQKVSKRRASSKVEPLTSEPPSLNCLVVHLLDLPNPKSSHPQNPKSELSVGFWILEGAGFGFWLFCNFCQAFGPKVELAGHADPSRRILQCLPQYSYYCVLHPAIW